MIFRMEKYELCGIISEAGEHALWVWEQPAICRGDINMKGMIKSMKRKIICLLIGALLIATAAGCGLKEKTAEENQEETGSTQGEESQEGTGSIQEEENQEENAAVQEADDGQAESAGDEALLSGKHYVNINIKDKGTIKVELDADAAPITVTNFVKLVKEGFYDGLTFHRIIKDFMMQGGDPTGTGMGSSDKTIVGEFASNGVENPISHTRGTISMARSSLPDSASCQFFIMHQDGTSLDGDYAAFGHVTEGMEIVDDICENTTGQDRNGVVPEENRPVIESIEYVE